MTRQRPGILSVRAINDYRRRNIFGYLALRHYLENSATHPDEWTTRVATKIVLNRTDASYYEVLCYKELSESGGYEHRKFHIPGPNEALAETLLLSECADHPKVFNNPTCVYSYELRKSDSRKGSYKSYFKGLQRRQRDISEACDKFKTGVVQFIDIKRFYPTIDSDLTKNAWNRFSAESRMADDLRELGFATLRNYSKVDEQHQCHVPTGPMFSHLIANLVFRDLDAYFSDNLPAHYFRYVDDIAVVGEKGDVSRSCAIIRERAKNLGFEFHPEDTPKNIVVPAKEWLSGRNDFEESDGDKLWKEFIGSLKQYLLANPQGLERLQTVFTDNGFNIPLIRYSGAIKEHSYLDRIRSLSLRPWFQRKVRSLTPEDLLQMALKSRDHSYSEFVNQFGALDSVDGFEKKRRITKLRYHASRLIYLLEKERLYSLSQLASHHKELYFHSQVMSSVSSHEINQIVRMGMNAAQATAQIIKNNRPLLLADAPLEEVSSQSLAVFLMNGVSLQTHNNLAESGTDLIKLARGPIDQNLMKNKSLFLSEMAALHGTALESRHSELLETAFDEDEAFTLDAIELLQQYDSI